MMMKIWWNLDIWFLNKFMMQFQGNMYRGTYQEQPFPLMFVAPCIIVQFIQKNPTRRNSVSKFIIPYLHEALHVSGNTHRPSSGA